MDERIKKPVAAWLPALAVLCAMTGPAWAQTAAPQKPCANGTDNSGQTLSDKLNESGGTLCPPGNVDPNMKAPTPPGGSTPVIPPPGSPGGNPRVQPK